MGCGGNCGGSKSSKSGGYSPKSIKNWGGMKTGNSSGRAGRASSRNTSGGGYGSPSVKMSFGKKR